MCTFGGWGWNGGIVGTKVGNTTFCWWRSGGGKTQCNAVGSIPNGNGGIVGCPG